MIIASLVDAIIGYNAEYIGKASVIGANCFINDWVGDYSITTTGGKIIQYLPHKAFFLEVLAASFEETLLIDDWEKVNEVWLNIYKNQERNKDDATGELVDAIKQHNKKRTVKLLEVSPENGNILTAASKLNMKADGIVTSKTRIPFILQDVQDQSTFNVRLRLHSDKLKIPIKLSSRSSIRIRDDGYDIVLYRIGDASTNKIKKLLQELERVCKKEGTIIICGEQAQKETINTAALELGLSSIREVSPGRDKFIRLYSTKNRKQI